MNDKDLVERFAAGVKVPDAVPVLRVRQYTVEDNLRRLKRLIAGTGEVCQRSLDRADYVHQEQRTLVRLPQGARAEVFHASGSLRVLTGLAPMEALFERLEPPEKLIGLVSEVAAGLRIPDWAGEAEMLDFERLWQIKATAADRDLERSETVLCRAVGAYRHFVREVPVLGAASVAIKVAGGGQVDSVSVHLLEPHAEELESTSLISPDTAARLIVRQLESQRAGSKTPLSELELSVQPLRLGYLHLGKRKAQQVLAPHYVAAVRVTGEEVEAYQLIVAATDKTYQPLCAGGHAAPVRVARRSA